MNKEQRLKELDKKITEIRNGWGEVSEYCQDQIMEEVSKAISKTQQATIEEIEDILNEFGDNPKEAVSILSEYLTVSKLKKEK